MTGVTVGIDPGGRSTGFAAIDAQRHVLAAFLITREGNDWDRYYDELRETVAQLRTQYPWSPARWAIEDLNDPNPHIGLANVRGLIDTSRVIGWLEVWLRPSRKRVVMVPPGGHGSNPLATYPGVLIGANETKGTGKRRHVRSAFDIAGTLT